MRTSAQLVAVAALAACSHPAPAPAAPTTPANKCAFVADHLISLMTEAAQQAPTDELDRVRGYFNQRCKDDGWSASAQDCFLALTKKEEVDSCAQQLTESQRAALEQPPPADAPKPPS